MDQAHLAPPVTCKHKNTSQNSQGTIKHCWNFGTCWAERGLKTASKTIAVETVKQCHLVSTLPSNGVAGAPLGLLRNSACVSAWGDNLKVCWSAG
jgi:hypothetical protein